MPVNQERQLRIAVSESDGLLVIPWHSGYTVTQHGGSRGDGLAGGQLWQKQV